MTKARSALLGRNCLRVHILLCSAHGIKMSHERESQSESGLDRTVT